MHSHLVLLVFDYFVWILWHINLCRLFNTKYSLHICIKHIRFGLVGFYGSSTFVGYLMSNPLYTYILYIQDFLWFGSSTIVGYLMPNPLYTYILYKIFFLVWLINHCRLFNAKSSLYIYFKYAGFGWVEFYGSSAIVDYLMPNPFLYI